jgi:predicted RNA binding protein YcfA (HicA-like mRNA interferase family)
MASKKDRLLADLKRKKYGATLKDAEAALVEWGFEAGRTKGHAQVWAYKYVTLTVHAPHGKSGKNLDPGAVAMVIRKIEEAETLQQEEESNGD